MLSRCALLALLGVSAAAASKPRCTHFRQMFPGRVVRARREIHYQPEECDLVVPSDAAQCVAEKTVVFVGDEVLQKSAWQIAAHSSMKRGQLDIDLCDQAPLAECRNRSALYQTKAGGNLAFVWSPTADAAGALVDENVGRLIMKADVVVLGGAVHHDARKNGKRVTSQVDRLLERLMFVKDKMKNDARLSVHTSHAHHVGKNNCMQKKTQAFAAVHEFVSSCSSVPVFNSYRLTKHAAVGHTRDGVHVHDSFLAEAHVLMSHICGGLQLGVSQRKCTNFTSIAEDFSLSC